MADFDLTELQCLLSEIREVYDFHAYRDGTLATSGEHQIMVLMPRIKLALELCARVASTTASSK